MHGKVDEKKIGLQSQKCPICRLAKDTSDWRANMIWKRMTKRVQKMMINGLWSPYFFSIKACLLVFKVARKRRFLAVNCEVPCREEVKSGQEKRQKKMKKEKMMMMIKEGKSG